MEEKFSIRKIYNFKSTIFQISLIFVIFLVLVTLTILSAIGIISVNGDFLQIMIAYSILDVVSFGGAMTLIIYNLIRFKKFYKTPGKVIEVELYKNEHYEDFIGRFVEDDKIYDARIVFLTNVSMAINTPYRKYSKGDKLKVFILNNFKDEDEVALYK